MLIVKKFGGSSVADKEKIFNVANRCIEDYRAGHDVVVVLSAMGDTTDELIALAQTVNASPKKRGHGNAEHGCSGSVAECISGTDAFHFQVWECQIQAD